MAPHSSTLAWKIPWTEEPGRLQSMGLLRVGHDWAASLFTSMHWRRKWQPTPVFLPGESQGWGSLVGPPLWGHTESDMTAATYQQQHYNSISQSLFSVFRLDGIGNYISWMCAAGFIWLLLQIQFWSYGCFASMHPHHFLSSLCCAYKVFVVYSEKGRRSKERAMIVIFMPEDMSPTPSHSVISYLNLFCTKTWVMYTLLLTGFTEFKNLQKL